MPNDETVDVVIIGSGHGRRDARRRACADGRADPHPRARRAARRQRAIRATRARSSSAAFSGRRKPGSTARGAAFNPGNYYYVGGNTKFYGAVLIRYRAQDFEPISYREGATPAWPFPYDELEPGIRAPRSSIGCAAASATTPPSRAIRALSVSARAGRAGDRQRARAAEARRPATLSAAARRRHRRWLKRARRRRGTPFPTRAPARWTPRPAASTKPLAHPNVELRTNARRRAAAASSRTASASPASKSCDRRRAHDVSPPRSSFFRRRGQLRGVAAALVATDGLANRSDTVGRNFMNHNCFGDAGDRPARGQRFRLSEDAGSTISISPTAGRPAARQRPAARARHRADPEAEPAGARRNGRSACMSRRSVDWYAMSEDLPNPGKPRDGRRRTDPPRLEAQQLGRARRTGRRRSRNACARRAIPIVLSQPFDRRTPSHQCGTVRIGHDPATSPLDPFCRAWDHPNLFVVDASFLPTSAGGQSGADDRGSGAARRRPHRQDRSSIETGKERWLMTTSLSAAAPQAASSQTG